MFLKHFRVEETFSFKSLCLQSQEWTEGGKREFRESSRMDIAETDNVGWTRVEPWKYREQVKNILGHVDQQT